MHKCRGKPPEGWTTESQQQGGSRGQQGDSLLAEARECVVLHLRDHHCHRGVARVAVKVESQCALERRLTKCATNTRLSRAAKTKRIKINA